MSRDRKTRTVEVASSVAKQYYVAGKQAVVPRLLTGYDNCPELHFLAYK